VTFWLLVAVSVQTRSDPKYSNANGVPSSLLVQSSFESIQWCGRHHLTW